MMKYSFKKLVKNIWRKFNYDIISYHPKLIDFLSHYRVDVVLDVGANIGQFGKNLRDLGYKGKIISLEPISHIYQELEHNAGKDPLWETVNIGLGNYDGKAQINISELSVFSSILNPLPRLKEFDIRSKCIANEEIVVKKLDSVIDIFYINKSNLFLKIDTQGYEKEIIQGATNSLSYFLGVQLEIAPITLYQGQGTFLEIVSLMEKSGFKIALIEPVNYAPDEPLLLEMDCIFINETKNV